MFNILATVSQVMLGEFNFGSYCSNITAVLQEAGIEC